MTDEEMQYHEQFMREALTEALVGSDKYDEVPVGAVIVRNGEIIARAHNEKEKTGFPTRHAEVVTIERAIDSVGDWRLTDCDIYITLEPCPMCCGAILAARMRGVYFGAFDQKAGSCATLFQLLTTDCFNHRVTVLEGGILQQECAEQLSAYFRAKRNK